MKVLVSPICVEEARLVVAGGADIVDIKNVAEGSLGAQGPWVLKQVTSEFAGQGVVCSAAIGDLPNKPGTIALAAYGAAMCGATYIKAGIHGASTYEEARGMMAWFVRAVRMANPDALAVVAGYADHARFGGVPHLDIVRAAKDAGADVVMLDTAVKDGKTLFDALAMADIKEFVAEAKAAGMTTALAGSINVDHLAGLKESQVDIVGVRGAVCDRNDRTKGVTKEGVELFMAQARAILN